MRGNLDPPEPPGLGAATPAPSTGTPRDPASSPTREAPEEVHTESWIAPRVVDGDTLDVNDGAASETVRILGIDTPERGECGFAAAAEYLVGLLGPVDEVMLSAAGSGKDDQDGYGRILGYVDAGGVDVGLALITQGLAIARYDSRDGYGAHPRQGAYVAADEATPAAECPPPGETNTPANPGNTKNCGDFASWRAAQDWFDYHYPTTATWPASTRTTT